MALHQPVRSGARAGRARTGSAAAVTKTAVTREIPDKLYFRIGEVARLCEVAPYVLRFWEGEFPQLKPNKGGTGQRLYRRRDVEMALRVKTLLYEEGYTIAGARQFLKSELRTKAAPTLRSSEALPITVETEKLEKLRAELQSLLAMLVQQAVAKPKGASVQPIRPAQPIRAAKPKPAPPIPEVAGLFDNLD